MANNRVISAVLTLKDKDFTSNAKKATSSTKDMERQVKHAQNSVSGFASSASSGFKSIAAGAASVAAAIGITKALSGAFNMVKSSVGSAFDRIDTMERFERTMTTMLGSTDAAKSALSGLSTVVDGTAYGLDTAARSVQDFVSRGVEVKKATGWFDSMGDAVAFFGDGSNEQLESVTTAMSKMLSSGKVSMQQMETLYSAGIMGPEVYAKATGKGLENVKKDLSSGKITAEEFFDVVTKGYDEGTNGVQKVAGTAKEAGATWKGAIGNMQFAVVRGVTSIISSLDELLENNGLPSMREMVTSFGKKFESVLKGSASFIQPFVDSMSGMVETIRPGLDWLKDTAFPAIKDELVAIYESAKPGLEWLKDTAFPGIVDSVKPAIDKFTEMYDFVKDHWSLIGPVVAGVTASVLAFKAGIVLMAAAKTVWAATTTAVTIATGLLNGTLALTPFGWIVIAIGAVVAIGIVLWKNWDTITEKALNLWSTVKTTFSEMKTNVVNWFGEMKDGAVEKFDGIVTAAKELPGKIGQGIKDFAKDAWSGMKDLATGLMDSFKSALGINSPSTAFFDMAKWIVKGLTNGLSAENLKNVGVNIFKDFAGGAFKTIESIKGFFTNAFSGDSSDTVGLGGKALASQLASKHGLRITSGHRPGARTKSGTLSDHATGNAYDLGGSYDGMWQAALEAQKNPAVKYVINRNMWSQNGGPWKPFPWGGHMDHTHISLKGGRQQGGRIGSSGQYLVGEAGPEIVDLPANSRVHNNQNSKRMNSDGNTINININGVSKTVNEIVNELVPQLKLRLANI